jgi:tRNA-specific 2-thiouridylase
VTDVSFVAEHPPPLPISVTVKIRYAGDEVAATLHAVDNESVRVTLAHPLRDITPGQGAVFYQGDVVLGGGIITNDRMEAIQ